MAIIRRTLDIDVVTAARERVERAFNNGLPVYLAMSGGKDSISLASITFDLIQEGRIDPKLLTVDFIDEEAVFEDIDRIVRDWRLKFIMAGAQFRWWCIPVKHFSCFNQLTSDESFVCWDPTMKDRWVREIPDFAITSHPLLNDSKETYQKFMTRIQGDGMVMVGVRASESVQRLYAMAQTKQDRILWPIFDWKDQDIWRYISDRNLDFPETYMFMYQLGSSRRDMRISQFFSIDTAKVLVKLGEYYPDLMSRVIAREPNAYLATLYWDSELFRRSKKREAAPSEKEEEIEVNYQEKVVDFITNAANLTTSVRIKNTHTAKLLLIKFGPYFTEKEWKMLYEALLAGDPKERTLRSIRLKLQQNRWEETQSDENDRSI